VSCRYCLQFPFTNHMYEVFHPVNTDTEHWK
jgi:hypothetical protein